MLKTVLRIITSHWSSCIGVISNQLSGGIIDRIYNTKLIWNELMPKGCKTDNFPLYLMQFCVTGFYLDKFISTVDLG